MSTILEQELLGLLQEVHQIRTSLFLDKKLLASKTAANAIAALNTASERIQVLYEAVSDKEAPDFDLPRDPSKSEEKMPLIANLENLYNLLKQQLAEAGVVIEPEKLKAVQKKRKAKRRKKQNYNNNKPGRKPL